MEKRLAAAVEVADLPQLRAQLASLENDAGAADLWEDAARAQQLMTRLNNMRSEVQQLQAYQGLLEEAAFAVELLEAEVRGGHELHGMRKCWGSGPSLGVILCGDLVCSCVWQVPASPWCGVVWCGVVWCGVVWCGVVWCGVM
jgi:hypothetical protein